MASFSDPANKSLEANVIHSCPAAGEELRYVVNPDAIDCPLGDGVAVLDPKNGVYFSLNATGALIWDAARHPVTVTDLSECLIKAFPKSDADFHADVSHVVSDLVEAGLFNALPHTPAKDG